MDETKMKDLLFALAWYDASAFHSENAKEILSEEFPGVSFTKALEEFIMCKNMPPGKGCPR